MSQNRTILKHLLQGKEKWKVMPLFEGRYKVSDIGNVMHTKRNVLKSRFTDERGYLRTGFYQNGKTKIMTIHRCVALTFIPNPENKPEVNHKDGEKLNNHISNLEWVTTQENIAHAIRNGLFHDGSHSRGELNIKSKLNKNKVLDIRAKHKLGVSAKDISKEYNICLSTTYRIITGKYWKHI